MLKQLLRPVLMAALLATICTALPAAQAAPGDLDLRFAGFNHSGKITAIPLLGSSMALAPDGKIVLVGRTGNSMAVRRYLPDGFLDLTFHHDGPVTISPPPGMQAIIPEAVAVQANGDIVVTGRNRTDDYDGANDFLLLRVRDDGNLDTLFGDRGFALTNFFNSRDLAQAVLIQPDGKIVVVGSANDVFAHDDDLAVARYTSGGKPDPTFDNDGKRMFALGDNDRAYDVALQSDGKLVVVGVRAREYPYSDDFALIRLNSNGSPDNSFGGGDGIVDTHFGDNEEAKAVAIQDNGYIVVLGRESIRWKRSFLARYKPNGELDRSLDGDGKLTIPVDSLLDLALQPDGKMMLLGAHTSPDGDTKFALHRLLPNGAHDPAFGIGGIFFHDLGDNDRGHDLALLPDGRILASGQNGDTTSALIRLGQNGITFDAGGQQTHAIAPALNELAYALAIQPNGAFLVAGELSAPGNTASNAFVTRFLADGRVSTTFGNQGTIHPAYVFSQPTFRGARALAVQPDGKIVMAGYSDVGFSGSTADFLVARWRGNGAPDFNFGASGFWTVNFPGNGDDYGTALALAPDGKIVVAGNVWNGSRQVWGVARLTSSGALDNTFDGDGMVVFGLDVSNSANAVAVQADGKILVAGQIGGDFAVARLTENGALDPSFGQGGFAINDLGGSDVINALALASNGWIYAAGSRLQNGGNEDMALAQYTPQGVLASCPDPTNCLNWPTGTFFMHWGISDVAYALDLRSDNQVVAAGCAEQRFAAVQVRTDSAPVPLPFAADFVGHLDCARAVKFSDGDRIVLAGAQNLTPITSDWNIALARFETTVANTPPPTLPPPPTSNVYPVYLPIIVR